MLWTAELRTLHSFSHHLLWLHWALECPALCEEQRGQEEGQCVHSVALSKLLSGSGLHRKLNYHRERAPVTTRGNLSLTQGCPQGHTHARTRTATHTPARPSSWFPPTSFCHCTSRDSEKGTQHPQVTQLGGEQRGWAQSPRACHVLSGGRPRAPQSSLCQSQSIDKLGSAPTGDRGPEPELKQYCACRRKRGSLLSLKRGPTWRGEGVREGSSGRE